MTARKSFIAGLCLLALCISEAIAQQPISKEQGFPLNEPILEMGAIFCESKADAVGLADLYGAPEKKINEFLEQAKCFQSNFVVTYIAQIHRAKNLNVYEANVRGMGQIFIVTDWTHKPKGMEI